MALGVLMKRPYRRRRRMLRRCAGVCQAAISVPKSSAPRYSLLVRKLLLLELRGCRRLRESGAGLKSIERSLPFTRGSRRNL
jgi:hypothetical protein